ncbi:MAG TPA: stage V sporulation protein AE [Clostridiaceae bacterium]|jgi:stage V sporulation protein AE|nr:stage V sporulation protein AE [Clostridiaceae bacterium]
MKKIRVILVTDGDAIAMKAVEEATVNIGGRCISMSAGNPTPITGPEIVDLIKSAKHDPVVVMVDDRGHTKIGKGEQAMDYIINNDMIDVMGVIAVASNTKHVNGVKVDFSIDKNGKLVDCGVDKHGNKKKNHIVIGDTVDILNKKHLPIIVGVGDPGKMNGRDSAQIGSPVITKAMEEIIKTYNKVR